MLNSGLFSSAHCDWATPQALFDALDAEFGPFTLDPCASSENAKCERFFTKEQDGLSQEWSGRVFMNPPYGRSIGAWMRKAFESVETGRAEIVVCLLPARTDTAWWHDYCAKGEVRFIRGRIKFERDGKSAPAPFPSCIVVFRKSIL